jgi:GrpB-like predicted nucleotidyltransferase (UPF0157 family)
MAPSDSERPAAMTEDQIKAATLGDPVILNGPVTLVDYDPRWPDQFTREAARVHGTLGRRALQVEHIGSTSVPGLAAKPVIDILLVAADSADEPSYVPALQTAGYGLHIREPDWHEHRCFTGPGVDLNLHVFTAGSPEIDRVVVFRDWLRSHPADRDLYQHTKRELARRTWTYRQNYADAKAPIVEQILTRAQQAPETR